MSKSYTYGNMEWLEQYARDNYEEDCQWYIDLYIDRRRKGMGACPSELAYIQHQNAKEIMALGGYLNGIKQML
jgi:hypothetical protein